MLEFMERNIMALQIFNVCLNIAAITYFIVTQSYGWLVFWIPNGVLASWILRNQIRQKRKTKKLAKDLVFNIK